MKYRKTGTYLATLAAAALLAVGIVPSVAGAAIARPLFGQPTTINQPVILNPGNPGSLSSLLHSPTQPVIDAQGDVFITNYGDGSNGGVTVIPGRSTTSIFGQPVTPSQPASLNPGNPDLDSLLDNPWGAAVDAQGDLFIANFSYLGAGSIVVIPGPSTTSLYGQSVTPNQPINLNPGSSPKLASLLNGPSGIALNQQGDLLVGNFSSGFIVAIPSPGTTSLFGQTVTPNQPAIMNPGISGSLGRLVTQPGAVSFNAQGDLFIDDYLSGNQITVIPSPATSMIFGQTVVPNHPVSLDPGASGALSVLNAPLGLAFDAAGDLFITDHNSNCCMTGSTNSQILVLPNATTSSVFGQSVTPNVPVVLDPGTPGSLAQLLVGPSGLGFDAAGDLYIANQDANTVIAISTKSAPGAPTGVSLAPSNGGVQVSWSEPADTGGLSILSYTATASPGGMSCTSSTTFCVIPGLASGVDYQVTVVAMNAVGTSEPSLVASVSLASQGTLAATGFNASLLLGLASASLGAGAPTALRTQRRRRQISRL